MHNPTTHTLIGLILALTTACAVDTASPSLVRDAGTDVAHRADGGPDGVDDPTDTSVPDDVPTIDATRDTGGDVPADTTPDADADVTTDVATDVDPADTDLSCPCSGALNCCPTTTGNVCVDIMSDPNRCGGCTSTCPANTACVGGQCCDRTCPSVVVRCATLTDSCGQALDCACPADWSCVMDSCAPPRWTVTDSTAYCEDDRSGQIACPAPGQDFYGQDGNTVGPLPDLVALDDEVAYDRRNGLMVTRNPLGQEWFEQAEASCENLVMAGFDDWRLPEVYEATSLLDYGQQPVLPTAMLRWAGSVWAGQTTNPNDHRYLNTAGLLRPANAMNGVVCVRGPRRVPDFEPIRSSSVDHSTGLQWAWNVVPARPWKDALGVCDGYGADGHTDWRTASIKELSSILDLNRTAAPFTSAPFGTNIVGSVLSGSPRLDTAQHYSISFEAGTTGDDDPRSALPVLCVRGPDP